jgi:phosphotransferase system enzyme I (PtsI)
MSASNQNLGTVLRGVGVSPGIVLGNATRFDRAELPVEHVHLPDSLLDAEVSRLHEAVERAERGIDTLHETLIATGKSEGEHLSVLDAHKMMLRDPMLLGETETLIREERVNAEWALSEALAHIQEIFQAMEDTFFRERGEDVEHVGDLLFRALRQDDEYERAIEDIPRGAIVIADNLSPAESLMLARLPVAAFAIDHGTPTSHTAIIAHSLNIPAVVGLRVACHHVGEGDRVIIDGAEGEIIAHPSPEEEIVYGRRARRAKAFFKALRQNRDVPAETKDGGTSIILRGNLDLIDEHHRIHHSGGEGVGLLRTEFLFLDRDDLPSEEEQLRSYARVLEVMAPHPVSIRTLDIGGDKLLKPSQLTADLSPALRAIRYSLRDRGLFDTQLRALLRASVHGQLRILLPFVSSLHEVRSVKRIIAELRQQLDEEGFESKAEIPLGVMIEIPAAALIADLLAKEADFFSVGTNDLIQYTLAAPRDDEAVDRFYQPIHPAMLRLLKSITMAAKKAKIEVSMCGEMAGDPRYALLLLALGFDELSMNAASIPRVKEVIRKTDTKQASRLLQDVMAMSSVNEITDYVDSYMVEHFAGLVVPKVRGAPRYAR